MLGPSDTARVVVVDPDPVRCADRVQKLGWRGFDVQSGTGVGMGAIHGFVFHVDEPAVLEAALFSAESGVVVVLTGERDADGLARALHAGVTAWLPADATPAELAEHLERGLDRIRARTLGTVASAAMRRMPGEVVVSDSAGRVMVASHGVAGAYPGMDSSSLVQGPGWSSTALSGGGTLHIGDSGPGTDGGLSVKLAQVSAFAGEAQHEVNNFATYVLANLDALMDDEWAEPPSREEQLEMTTESHEGAMGMVDVVRRLRRAVQTLAVPARARCSLGDLARAAAAEVGGPVDVEAPSDVWVLGDGARLKHALGALMRSARAHGDGDRVSVDISTEQGTARVWIAGEGAGLDHVAGRALFTSFLKTKGLAAPEPGCLSVVSAIALEHGGSSGVREDGRGGRWFRFEIPDASTTDP